MSNFAAIIPAAGFSSRMGLFKPLLPFGSSLVIERTINSFKLAGITDIRVVVGYKKKLLQPLLDRLSVKVIFNPNFVYGMFTSIKTGVKSIENSIDAFFILPGDCPFIQPRTIAELQKEYINNPSDIIYPVYRGQRGHPILISSGLKTDILNNNAEGGLAAVLEKITNFTEIPVQDQGIIHDMDTVRDYLEFPGNNAVPFPSPDECILLLQKSNISERVILHSKEVSRIAVEIAEYLNSYGHRVNTGLIMAAGFLHDIARDQEDHPRKGAEMIAGFGYKEVADIIAQHMDISQDAVEAFNEASVVYLADKLLKEDKLIFLDKRMAETLAKFENNKTVTDNVIERFRNAFTIKEKIEKKLGMSLKDVLGFDKPKE